MVVLVVLAQHVLVLALEEHGENFAAGDRLLLGRTWEGAKGAGVTWGGLRSIKG